MATLAADLERDYGLGDQEEFPVIAADIIYKSAAVGENGSGYSRPLVAGDKFQGFCLEQVDNSGGSAGDKNVKVRRKGTARLTVAGATAITANDHPAVYASDDNTFTLTKGSNSFIGYVRKWLASTDCMVDFNANPDEAVTEEAAITGTLTGTTDGAMEDVADIALSTSDTYTDAAVNAAVNAAILETNLQLKELQTKLNALIADLG